MPHSPKQCNCENLKCKHSENACTNEVGGQRMAYVGRICDECAKNCPPEYLVREPKKEKQYKGHFQHRDDRDIDQITREEIHPDALEFEPEEKVLENEEEAEEELYNRMNREGTMINSNELLKLAEQLENPENETLVAAERDEELLDKVASSFMKAAEALREVAEIAATFEPMPEPFTAEKLDEIAAVAEAFAESDDELLQKQASVLDDILLTLASPKNALMFSLAVEDDRIAELKKKYKETREKQLEWNKVSESVEDIEKSEVYKQRDTNEIKRPLQEAISARSCPNHPGVMLQRVGENHFRCSLGGEDIDWNDGFTTQKGAKIPGTSVQNQQEGESNSFTSFDSRALRMGFNPGE